MSLAVDVALAERLLRALDAAMSGGDFGFAERIRQSVGDLVEAASLRVQLRPLVDAAVAASDERMVRSVSDILLRADREDADWRADAVDVVEQDTKH